MSQDLEARVKALEDQWQRLAQAILAPPSNMGRQGAPFETRQPNQPAPTTPPPTTDLSKLPKEITDCLTVNLDGTVTQDYIHDQTLLGQVRDAMKAAGYTWVSNGKASHWERKA